MNEKYSSLFTPWKIGNCEIKNRIVQVGGTSLFGWLEPCHFDKEAAYHILNRAQNNVGLVLPGMQCVRDTMGIPGRHWLYQNKRMFRELAEWMPEFHKTGAKLFIQLSAGMGRSMAINQLMVDMLQKKALGAVAKGVLDVDYVCASSSETPNRWYPEVKSRALTKEEIHEMIEAFGKTAKMLMDAGVDGVEIHAVHEGYLLDQFAIANMNYRTDEYGGSFENRYRFAVEIVQEIKKLCGKDFPVSLRYSVVSKTKGFGQGAVPGEEFVEFGRDMAESEKAIKYLEDAGYDMFNCDNGTYDAWYWAHPGPYMPQNCNLEDVAHIKKFVDIPVVCAGRMEPDVGAEAIAEGKIDGLGVARQFLTDPAWVTKLMNDDIASIHPCICCHNACFNMASYKGDDGQLVGNDQTLADNAGMARCALNPQTMQSKKYKIVKAAHPKRIAVIGGGIGGMEVARVATLRGHKVTIYEKSNVLGGVFIAAAAPSFKEKDRDLIKWYEKEIKDLNIEVKFNTEVKPEDIAKLGADEVVVATGSKARKLRVPGAEKGIEACEYLLGTKEVGNKVIVIGGGLSGCEIALDLYNKGKTPVIVEMKNDLVAMRGVCLANTSYLRDFFALNKVDVRLNTGLVEITDKGVKVKDLKTGKESEIAGDSVIMSVGYIPTPVAKDGVKLVGDCNGIGNLRTVIWRAWDVAMKL